MSRLHWASLAVLVIIVGIAGVTVWLQRQLSERDRVENDLIDRRGADMKRSRAAPRPAPRLERSTRFGDEVLWVDLLPGDPREATGGRRLLSLRGNGEIFRRPVDRVAFERGVVDRTLADLWISEILELAQAPGPSGGQLSVSVVTETRTATVQCDLIASLTAPLRDRRDLVPRGVWLQMRSVQGSADSPSVDWPFPATSPDRLTVGGEIAAPTVTVQRVVGTWLPGQRIRYQDSEDPTAAPRDFTLVAIRSLLP